jgi:hypothetical protein
VDLGTSILGSATGVSAIFGTVTIIIKLIGVKQPKPTAGGNNGNGKCPAHVEIEQRLKDGDKEMQGMKGDIEGIREDTAVTRQAVIAIASHLNIPLGAIEKEMKEMVK